jgi:hypothetical protein
MQKMEKAQHLAALREREQKARDAEIRLKAQAEAVARELKSAQAEAEKLFGTSDVATLREKFRKANEEDMRAIKEYEESLSLREQLLETTHKELEGLRLN